MLETLILLVILALVLIEVLDAGRNLPGLGLLGATAGGGTGTPLPWEPTERGADTMVFKKGSDSAPSADPNIGKAALKSAETGEDWLAFSREQFGIANERQEELDALTKQIGEQQIAAADRAATWSIADRARWEEKFLPMQDEYIDKANNWDSPEQLAKAAAEAKTDVVNNATQMREVGRRRDAALGVRPGTGRWNATERAGELGTALAGAGAQNIARDRRVKEGMALEADAINMGNGLPSQAAGGAGLALTAGNAALAGAGNADASFRANTGIVGQGFAGAMQGYGQQASILNTQYQNDLQRWQIEQESASAGIGGIFDAIGTGIGAYAALSTKKAKEDGRPAPDGALEQVNSLPIEEWKYRKGMADGGEHIGPYAEDFKAATGKGDGTSIPFVDGLGVTMKAVQELSRKVDKLATKRAA